MKSIIRWAVHHAPGMNTLMLAVLVVGGVSMSWLRREVFPEFELEIVYVTVPYPGASPDEIEEGICQKMEEAVRSIAGIKKQTSVAQEGSGTLVLELEADVPDVQKILNEVKTAIDRIPSFPDLSEDPDVQQITLRSPAIRVGVVFVGPGDGSGGSELQLREVTESVRDEILQLSSVSQAEVVGSRSYQIDIEIPEQTLRKYGLSLKDVARTVRRQNVELPGGKMITDSQQVLMRGKDKRLVGDEIKNIPIVTQANGVVLTLEELGEVRDEFADTTSISRINGKPGLPISVNRTSTEDVISIVDEVLTYAETAELPPGYELVTWRDRSVDVRDRIDLLTRNGMQGLVLVFLVLAVFLEIRLAFWVAMGIPISVLGACVVLYMTGQTLNMLSMFAFLMALGIVVDDAIVVGENIYEHRRLGKGRVRAAIDGTIEVIPSVTASVLTTIIAFSPMLFVAGIMGKFIAVMPVAVIAMLAISLIESMTILPCHLGHGESDKRCLAERMRGVIEVWPVYTRIPVHVLLLVHRALMDIVLFPWSLMRLAFGRINGWADRNLNWFVTRVYLPLLRRCLQRPSIAVSLAGAVMVVAVGAVVTLKFTEHGLKVGRGVTPFVLMPKLDSRAIYASIAYPDGTSESVTSAAVVELERAFEAVDARASSGGPSATTVIHRFVGRSAGDGGGAQPQGAGSHFGGVSGELVDSEERSRTSQELIALWRAEAGEFPGAESLVFSSPNMGPGGIAIEFKLLADGAHVDKLEDAVEACKQKLASYRGVSDVEDDSRPGKWEYQLRVKPLAEAMGVPLADVAETVRASYYGEEVMRLQRGRHEVKLMVRYPREERRSLAAFNDIRVRGEGGVERPIEELAKLDVKRGYSEINRINQKRSITISADVDEAKGNARAVVSDLRENFLPELLAEHSGVSVRWEGQQERTRESLQSMFKGFAVAMLAMFVLLTFEFRSFLQPLLILAIIPFGAIGAILGHFVMGMPLTLFSMFGLVALTGVVVNDSIVLVDFINHRIEAGLPLKEALLDAGQRRFRPVMLTSVTTIAGLLPIMLETSLQAQVVIPMATSLTFGLSLTTLLVLFLVPTFYYMYGRVALVGVAVSQEGGDAFAELEDVPSDEEEPDQFELVGGGS